ncbi:MULTISPECIES: aldose 1-epimerase family protein [unclassified Microbacterium]|uniref:aldose 1-epimerase family protein n=1 Tax=unclassified Microbacterium TaxID=2609290 RepID=UPI000EAA5033|nr:MULTISPECIES: aldose 1-epimerase family protein [unclassified Microbacterium]MBT2483644.1 aldose 1-epimerase family protein [Microbacterium sp. ISL-108]RKN66646.1 galactose mutarotase [Microbacterium sp. CGR2]
MLPRSGRQLRLAAHGYEAAIASVGATLRMLTFEGRDLVVPFDADEVRPGYRGTTLAPWPNRVVDGRYRFEGSEHQLALTEPERGQALHGLLAWTEFSDRLVLDDRVVLAAVIEPQTGYPFRVEVETEYRLSEDGLTQTVTARNIGADAAPWGTGPHPYLVAGPRSLSEERSLSRSLSEERSDETKRLDAWTLTLPASEVLTVTPDRLSPIAVESVSEHPEWDFRNARPIGDVFIDHAFTGLQRTDGLAEVRLVTDDGTGVAMTWDERCPWVQVHTADTPAEPSTHRIGLAVEPMTCPPDAFNSGADLVTLAPGATHAAAWSIRAV